MPIVPFECTFRDNKTIEPEIQLLEIRPRGTDETHEPCAWVFVRREEKYTLDPKSKEVQDATITVSYHAVETRIWPKIRMGGTFQAGYSHWCNRISLTGLSALGRGGVMVSDGLRSMRLGTYLFNIIVGWAMQWPIAEVNSIGLAENDGHEDNRTRRNRFYEQFGLEFEYTDPKGMGGHSRPMPASDLHQVTSWKQNIIVHKVDEHLGKLLIQNARLRSDLAARERAIKQLTTTMNDQEAHPIRTALRVLWARNAWWFVLLLVILGLAAKYHWLWGR